MNRVFSQTFTGYLFSEPISFSRHRFALAYENRPIATPIHVHLPDFVEYGLDVGDFIHNLGWDFLLLDPPSLICPELVQYFYSNLRSFGLQSRCFSTVVYGHLVTIPVPELARILNIPPVGEVLAHESELWRYNFDISAEFLQLTGIHPGPATFLPVNSVMPRLRALYFVITRIFLPRTQSLDIILPLDLWIMAHAAAGIPLDFSYLLFEVFMTYGDSSFPGPLPFGPLITQLIIRLGISFTSFHTVQPSWVFLIDQVLDELEISNEGEMDAADTEEDEDEVDDPEEVPEDVAEAAGNDDDDLDRFGAAVVMPGGFSRRLVDYSSDESVSLAD
ncbi:unnamed protein product [Linum trigynum]|uniref:Uncharacterized protein n=1 Tax=Linum trigynum TaxID=586398 RepID=A0AAV2CFA4_9ROSI